MPPPASHTDWSDLAAAYAGSFAPMCAGTVPFLLASLAPSYDEIRLLDVGSGTGAVAAAALARGAEVTAAEPDRDMRALAAATVAGLRQVDAGLPELPFEDGAFDVVVANFVVNHVADPRAAVAELLRVTAPAGRVGVTVWPNGATWQNTLWADVLGDVGVDAPVGTPLPAALDFPRSPEGLAGLLTGAGAVGVEATELRWDWRVDPDALWSGPAGGVSGFGQVLVRQPADVQEALRAAYDRRTAPLRDGTEIVLRTRAVVAVATR